MSQGDTNTEEEEDVSPWQGAVLSLCLLETVSVLVTLFLDLRLHGNRVASTLCLRPVAGL